MALSHKQFCLKDSLLRHRKNFFPDAVTSSDENVILIIYKKQHWAENIKCFAGLCIYFVACLSHMPHWSNQCVLLGLISLQWVLRRVSIKGAQYSVPTVFATQMNTYVSCGYLRRNSWTYVGMWVWATTSFWKSVLPGWSKNVYPFFDKVPFCILKGKLSNVFHMFVLPTYHFRFSTKYRYVAGLGKFAIALVCYTSYWSKVFEKVARRTEYLGNNEKCQRNNCLKDFA